VAGTEEFVKQIENLGGITALCSFPWIRIEKLRKKKRKLHSHRK
jgi:hypothetical protein